MATTRKPYTPPTMTTITEPEVRKLAERVIDQLALLEADPFALLCVAGLLVNRYACIKRVAPVVALPIVGDLAVYFADPKR